MRALLKALLTTGGGTIIGQLLQIVVNKVLAQTLGSGGIGFYSLVRQLQDTGVAVGTMGIGGLVQGLAAREGAARRRLLIAAASIAAAVLVAGCAVLLFMPGPIARGLFGRDDPETVMTVALCAVPIAVAVCLTVLNSAINAMRAIRALFVVGLSGSVAAALIVFPVARAAAESAVHILMLVAIPLVIQTVVGLAALRRLGWWKTLQGDGPSRPGDAEFVYFAKFLGLNAALTAANIGIMVSIRAAIVHDGGLENAGLFAAGWGVGMQSMSVLLSSFGTYGPPTMASATPDERLKHLQDTTTLMLCASIPLLTALIALKPLVLAVLYSSEFFQAISLLQLLLLANFLKAVSWVLAIPLLATADVRRYFAIELTWYACFGAGALGGLHLGYGMEAVGVAFLFAYLVYLGCSAYLARVRFGFTPDSRSLALFIAGSALIGLTAVATWNSQSVDPFVTAGATMLALVLSWYGLTPERRRKVLAAVVPGGRG